MGSIPIQFEMDVEVNDDSFSVTGSGEADRGAGRCSLDVEFDTVPAGFDPVSCPLICQQQTSLAAAASRDERADIVSLADWDYRVSPDRMGIIRDQDGAKLAQLEVNGNVSIEDETIVSQQTMDGFSDLPAIERNITPVTDYILPNGPGEATGVTRYKLETTNGRVLYGITTIPYKWDNEKTLANPITRTVDVDVAWDGGTSVEYEYEIEMSTVGGDVVPSPQPVLTSSD